MDYFTQIPKVFYPTLEIDNPRPDQFVALTNILTRSAFLQEIVENASMFYEYQVKDGETPEVIAHKLYGAAQRYWIVLLFNQLSNPYYDFPLVQEQLDTLVENKYGTSLQVAQATIHHHYEKVTRTILFNGVVQSESVDEYTLSPLYADPSTGAAVARPFLTYTPDSCVDVPSLSHTQTFANGITVATSTKYCNITNYTYEFEENEKRRSIKLLDARYVGAVENEFRRLMRNGN